MITKEEIKYMMMAGGFAFTFFIILIPFLLKRGIQNSSPLLQFFIFNVGIFIFLQIYLKAKALSSGVNLRKTFEIMFIFMSIDTLIPPLLVSPTGVLSNEAILSASASDYLWGHIALSFGLYGFWVYLFTYMFMPLLLLFIASKLNGNFVTRL